MILFLDFDGVLHPDPCYDPEQYFVCLPRLESVLSDFPNVEVVVSSTWRETRTLAELKSLFSSDFSNRIVGVTPRWKDHPDIFEIIGYQRHAEIEAWLRLSNQVWHPWLAIDDKPYLFRPFLSNLVKTDPHTGFDVNAERALREKLKVVF